MRPGEEKNVEVKVTSPLERLGNSNVTLLPQPIKELKVSPDSFMMRVPGEASNSTLFNIEALEDINTTLPITRTLVMDTIITIPDFTQQQDGIDIKSNSLTNTISQSFSNLTITLLSRLTFEEQFTAFWNVYGSVISLVGGGFAAGFAALVLNRLKKNKSNNLH